MELSESVCLAYVTASNIAERNKHQKIAQGGGGWVINEQAWL